MQLPSGFLPGLKGLLPCAEGGSFPFVSVGLFGSLDAVDLVPVIMASASAAPPIPMAPAMAVTTPTSIAMSIRSPARVPGPGETAVPAKVAACSPNGSLAPLGRF